MAALLVAMSIMAIAMSVALPVWHTAMQREKEAELIFRGQQYARAVMLYQRRFPGAFRDLPRRQRRHGDRRHRR